MEYNSHDLLEQLVRLSALLHRSRHLHHPGPGPGGDPHRGQGRVLKLLALQPEIGQKELAYLLGIRSQSLGELLSKLEKSGYITREPSATDKRAMLVRLTEKGREEAAKPQENHAEQLFATLNEQEQQQLGALLARLIAALEEQWAEAAPADFAAGWDGSAPYGPGCGPHRPPHGPRTPFGGGREGHGRWGWPYGYPGWKAGPTREGGQEE